MILRRLCLCLTLLALAGCASLPAARTPVGAWRLQNSPSAGAALIYGADARAVLLLACRRAPTGLYVASDDLTAANGPVTLTVGGRSFPLSPRRDEPRLAAVGPFPDGLPAALMSGDPIVLTAGRQASPRLPAPDGKLVAAFVIACRAETANG